MQKMFYLDVQQLKGNTADGSYHLEIYSPEHQEKMPHDMNVWEIVGEAKEN